jgi:hypothetical protein
MCHLLDNIIQIASDDRPGPRCCGADGYLHPNLATRQPVGLEQPAMVDSNRPVITKSHECTQQHLGEAEVVSARGPQPTVLAEDAVRVVIHVHL